MRSCIADNRGSAGRRGPGRPAAGAFTLIETIIVMAIIAILASIVLLAIRHVKNTGNVVAEQGMVTTLQKAVEGYKQKYGTLPPLVVDSGPGPTGLVGPISGTTIVVWDTKNLFDPNSTLNGSTPGDRRCYSQYSLAYYIVGALDREFDGVDGLGYTEPTRDGQFTKRGHEIKPFFDVTGQRTRTSANRLYIPNAGTSTADQRIWCVIWDRWSDGATTLVPAISATSTSYPIRYYRWLPAYYPAGDPKAGQVQYWNIPVEIGGNPNNTLPPLKAELKSAEYAIVSAGPDHVFGTADDIMEVGQ